MTKDLSIERHFDKVALSYDSGKEKYSYYYTNLKKLLLGLIGKNKDVFEFGCGTGELLHSLKLKYGYGFDISSEMVSIAKSKFKNSDNLIFSTDFPKKQFDYIFLSDVIEHLEKPLETFKKLSGLMHKDSKLVLTMANPVWEPMLMFWEKMGWKMPEGPHKRIVFEDLKDVVHSSGMKIVKHDYTLLMPVKIPVVTNFANKYLEKTLRRLCFIEYLVIKKS